jgi:hypothetical protein
MNAVKFGMLKSEALWVSVMATHYNGNVNKLNECRAAPLCLADNWRVALHTPADLNSMALTLHDVERPS